MSKLVYLFRRRWFLNLKRAEHLLAYADIYHDQKEKLLPYEYGLIGQRFKQKIRILVAVLKKLLVTVFYLFIAYIVENYVYDFLGQVLDSWFETQLAGNGRNWFVTVFTSLLAAIIVELFTSTVAKLLKNEGDYTISAVGVPYSNPDHRKLAANCPGCLLLPHRFRL